MLKFSIASWITTLLLVEYIIWTDLNDEWFIVYCQSEFGGLGHEVNGHRCPCPRPGHGHGHGHGKSGKRGTVMAMDTENFRNRGTVMVMNTNFLKTVAWTWTRLRHPTGVWNLAVTIRVYASDYLSESRDYDLWMNLVNLVFDDCKYIWYLLK